MSVSQFEKDLQFIQLLTNPNYISLLKSKGYFNNKRFMDYLKHLRYFYKKPYLNYITYPNALTALENLLNEE